MKDLLKSLEWSLFLGSALGLISAIQGAGVTMNSLGFSATVVSLGLMCGALARR